MNSPLIQNGTITQALKSNVGLVVRMREQENRTAGKLVIQATDKQSVKLRPPITQQATQVPSEGAALGEDAAEGSHIRYGTCSLLLIAQDDKEDEFRQKLTHLETEVKGSTESRNFGLCKTIKADCFCSLNSKSKCNCKRL